jgi:ATP-binding cassette subfamily B protein/subfamily B ATP-binding cassette protein MsbA
VAKARVAQALDSAWQGFSTLTLGLFPSWNATTPVSRLIRQTASSHKKLLLCNLGFALLLGAAEACLFAAIYLTLRVLTGTALPEALGWPRSLVFLLLLISLLILQMIASFSRAMTGTLSGRFAARCQAQVVPKVHRFILSLSYGCASSFRIGDLAHRASLAPLAIQTEIEQTSLILSDALLGAIYLLVLVLISPWMMLLAAGLAMAMVFTQSRLRPRIRQASREVEQQQRQIASALTADLQVLRLLHSSASTDQANQSFQKRLEGLEQKLRRLSFLRSLMEPIGELLPMLAAVTLGLLSWQLTNGRPELVIPGLATFVLALQRLNLRFAKLGLSFNMLAENMGRIELLNELLQHEGKIFRRRGGRPFAGLQREIRFQGVKLRYPEKPDASVRDLEFSLPRGSTVALVGASGAGKSTIADLLVGLLNPTEGQILIDGVDLQRLDLDSWQRHLGVVSQDVLLLNDTIAANITFGMGDSMDSEAIRKAAQAACADEFIQALPATYGTLIGEHGHRLSGGQRQRLSLARAILRQPDILILDEATSALDSHSEAKVHQAIQAFSSGRTVLAIAHRLSSIRDASEILVIDEGRIVERGNHTSLLAAAGPYAALWQLQQNQAPAVPLPRP